MPSIQTVPGFQGPLASTDTTYMQASHSFTQNRNKGKFKKKEAARELKRAPFYYGKLQKETNQAINKGAIGEKRGTSFSAPHAAIQFNVNHVEEQN